VKWPPAWDPVSSQEFYTGGVENTISKSSSIISCGFFAVLTCLFAKTLLINGCIYPLIKNLLPSSGCYFVVLHHYPVTCLHATIYIYI
jgi:hypothetical protein